MRNEVICYRGEETGCKGGIGSRVSLEGIERMGSRDEEGDEWEDGFEGEVLFEEDCAVCGDEVGGIDAQCAASSNM